MIKIREMVKFSGKCAECAYCRLHNFTFSCAKKRGAPIN